MTYLQIGKGALNKRYYTLENNIKRSQNYLRIVFILDTSRLHKRYDIGSNRLRKPRTHDFNLYWINSIPK